MPQLSRTNIPKVSSGGERRASLCIEEAAALNAGCRPGSLLAINLEEPNMRSHLDETAWRLRRASVFVGLALTLMVFVMAARAQTPVAEQKAAEQKAVPEVSQTFYLVNNSQQNGLNDIQTALRNMLSRARIYGVPTQNAISIRGSAEDLAMAQKLILELDRPQKLYRLTYTITGMDGGKAVGVEHFELVVPGRGKATLKQGSRVPIVTGSYDVAGTTTPNTQVQYQDVGLSIEASLDGESLQTKVEQTSVADERSVVGLQDPILRQTVLDATANLTVGKSAVLGALDIPGSTRHQEIAVAWEVVK
jgi:type II secretory pathway component GspD/PulD (secretin)